MQDIITIIVTIVASSGAWSFLTAIVTSRRANKTSINNLVLAIARDKLLVLAKQYISLKYIPDDELENFVKMYEAYVSANGNSTVKMLAEEALKLPIHSKYFESKLP